MNESSGGQVGSERESQGLAVECGHLHVDLKVRVLVINLEAHARARVDINSQEDVELEHRLRYALETNL